MQNDHSVLVTARAAPAAPVRVTSRLTPSEEASIRSKFFAAKEGIKTAVQLAEVLYKLGEGVSEEEAHVLALQTGHDFAQLTKAGCCVSLDRFLAMMGQLKLRRLRAQADPTADTVDAFVAMGGHENKGGAVSSKTLQKVVTDFDLNVDVDRFVTSSPGALTARGGRVQFQQSFSESQMVGYDIFETMLQEEKAGDEEDETDAQLQNGSGDDIDDSMLAAVMTEELSNAIMNAPQQAPALLISALANRRLSAPGANPATGSATSSSATSAPPQSQQSNVPSSSNGVAAGLSNNNSKAVQRPAETAKGPQTNGSATALPILKIGFPVSSSRPGTQGGGTTTVSGDAAISQRSHQSVLSGRLMQALKKDRARAGGVRSVLLRHHLRQAELQAQKPSPAEARIYEFVRENKPYLHLRKFDTPQWIANDLCFRGVEKKSNKKRRRRRLLEIPADTEAKPSAAEIQIPGSGDPTGFLRDEVRTSLVSRPPLPLAAAGRTSRALEKWLGPSHKNNNNGTATGEPTQTIATSLGLPPRPQSARASGSGTILTPPPPPPPEGTATAAGAKARPKSAMASGHGEVQAERRRRDLSSSFSATPEAAAILHRICKGVQSKFPGYPLSHDPTLAGLLARFSVPAVQKQSASPAFGGSRALKSGRPPVLLTPQQMMVDKTPMLFMAELKAR